MSSGVSSETSLDFGGLCESGVGPDALLDAEAVDRGELPNEDRRV